MLELRTDKRENNGKMTKQESTSDLPTLPQSPKKFRNLGQTHLNHVQPKFSLYAGAYFLLESILSTPLHAELCLELARSCAGWDRGPGLLANVGLAAASSARSSWGNAPAPTAQQLLRQRNAIQAAGPQNDGYTLTT